MLLLPNLHVLRTWILTCLFFDPCIYVTDPICLRISHNSITEGGIVTFGGKYGANYDLRIIDSSSDNVIAFTTTDSAGNFSVTWTAQYNNGNPTGFMPKLVAANLLIEGNSVTLDVLPDHRHFLFLIQIQ